MFDLHRDPDPARFLAEARPFLLEHEDEHALLWGVLGGLVRTDAEEDEDPPGASADEPPGAESNDDALLLRLERDGATVGAALRTPPRKLVLGRLGAEDAAALARTCAERRADGEAWELPGVVAASEEASAFAEAYRAAGGCGDARLVSEQRLFVADEVLPVRGALGRMRLARPSDRDLVGAWLHAFRREAQPDEEDGAARAAELAREYIPASEARGVFLWETDDGPATMASYLGPTPNGIRIAAVYTPRDKRRRGYATALVSAMSNRLFERYQRCYLFTDLANPTSSDIYTRLGYRPVIDVQSWAFDEA